MSTSETAVTDVVLEKKKSSKRDKSREPRELAKETPPAEIELEPGAQPSVRALYGMGWYPRNSK